MMVWRPPHTFRPDRVPFPIPLLPRTATFDWLLCCPTKRWPSKAELTSLSLIFNVLRFSAPNEGTNSNKSAPIAARLVWAHRDQWRQDLGPWRMLPCQNMATPLGGRVAVSHVGCCVFVLLCFVLDRTFGSFWIFDIHKVFEHIDMLSICIVNLHTVAA